MGTSIFAFLAALCGVVARWRSPRTAGRFGIGIAIFAGASAGRTGRDMIAQARRRGAGIGAACSCGKLAIISSAFREEEGARHRNVVGFAPDECDRTVSAVARVTLLGGCS